MRKLGWLATLIALLALTAWACGGGDDDDGGSDDPGSGNITDACEGDIPDGVPGDVTDDLPDDFPDDLPIYDGADFRCGYSGEADGESAVAGIWTTGDSIDDVKAFYDEELGGDGPWSSAGSGSAAGSTFWTVTKEDSSEGGVITLTSEGDDTVITAVISDDLDDLSGDDDSGSGDEDGDEPASDPDPSGGDDDDGASGDLPDEVDLPDGFPSDDIDIPDGARIINASTFTSGGVQSFVVEFLSQDSVNDLATHFKDSFEGKGWGQSFQTESNGLIAAAYAENDDGSGKVVSLTIGESPYDGYSTVSFSILNSN